MNTVLYDSRQLNNCNSLNWKNELKEFSNGRIQRIDETFPVHYGTLRPEIFNMSFDSEVSRPPPVNPSIVELTWHRVPRSQV